MQRSKKNNPLHATSAFTLIELLTVVAIIGILAAIIIPTVGAVQVSSRNAKTKVQFSQLTTAVEQFRQENGFYPFFKGDEPPKEDTAINLGSDKNITKRFVEILTGKKLDGTSLTDKNKGDPLVQNKRRASYYTFSGNELVTDKDKGLLLKDAFENEEIVVVVDYDYNGLIAPGAVKELVQGVKEKLKPEFEDTTTPIRAGVLFYSAGRGQDASDIVKSW